MDRRKFLTLSSSVGIGFSGLSQLIAQQSQSNTNRNLGKLHPYKDSLLDLPHGFKATVIAKTGEEMSDGLIRPGKPDGMGAFAGNSDNEIILVCNHEVSFLAPELSGFEKNLRRFKQADKEIVANKLPNGQPLFGGTTTLHWQPSTRKTIQQKATLLGTERNCAGGVTPWNTWITCEEPENLDGPASFYQSLGWCYEVPVQGKGNPNPIKAMGRFRHEAIAIDPKTGIVYLTEDRGDGIFYRYKPKVKGDLHAGGTLEALAFVDQKFTDTRNWNGLPSKKIKPNESHSIKWVELDNVKSPRDDLRFRGVKEKGAAIFARAEGIWFGENELYFACTNGGEKQLGQIFRYQLSPHEGTSKETVTPGKLELFVEPNNQAILENADNLTIAPWGDIIVCEDGAGVQYIRGITPNGQIYNIAKSDERLGEFAGACFAPNHPILFINSQKAGLTFAIEGPWPSA